MKESIMYYVISLIIGIAVIYMLSLIKKKCREFIKNKGDEGS